MMDWKAIVFPAIATGLIAGGSEFLLKYGYGWKSALVAAGVTALIQGARFFLEKYAVEPFQKRSTGAKKKRRTWFVFE